MSPNIEKILNKNIINNINDLTKNTSILNNVIAKKNNINKDNIVLFANEYDAIKKYVIFLLLNIKI